MSKHTTEYATYGTYVFLGAATLIISVCKGIEAGNDWLRGHEVRRRQLTRWARYWAQKPSERLKQR
jgi:hypothetical protein